MKVQDNQQFHFGVYGIYFKNDEVLVIKKGRGPYKGLYDLPGGRIEFGEKIEETLRREFEEEVGIPEVESKFLGYNEYFCTFTNDVGEAKDFHHTGLYFVVNCDSSTIKNEADGHDSLGAVFVPLADLNENNCAAIALQMIQKAQESEF